MARSRAQAVDPDGADPDGGHGPDRALRDLPADGVEPFERAAGMLELQRRLQRVTGVTDIAARGEVGTGHDALDAERLSGIESEFHPDHVVLRGSDEAIPGAAVRRVWRKCRLHGTSRPLVLHPGAAGGPANRPRLPHTEAPTDPRMK